MIMIRLKYHKVVGEFHGGSKTVEEDEKRVETVSATRRPREEEEMCLTNRPNLVVLYPPNSRPPNRNIIKEEGTVSLLL